MQVSWLKRSMRLRIMPSVRSAQSVPTAAQRTRFCVVIWQVVPIHQDGVPDDDVPLFHRKWSLFTISWRGRGNCIRVRLVNANKFAPPTLPSESCMRRRRGSWPGDSVFAQRWTHGTVLRTKSQKIWTSRMLLLSDCCARRLWAREGRIQLTPHIPLRTLTKLRPRRR